ncbi:hypothetical protein DPMN_084453 [Dreissena polymorpha]|uniref:Uncharacterized protein n=1 Tax=Dreissena polymorpha TaxID=45954 RepID=A0A9D4BJE3_DREPO|nr:hypothetical protein DPMN_084453 [Dreissena polymorpha]
MTIGVLNHVTYGGLVGTDSDVQGSAQMLPESPKGFKLAVLHRPEQEVVLVWFGRPR